MKKIYKKKLKPGYRIDSTKSEIAHKTDTFSRLCLSAFVLMIAVALLSTLS